MSTAATEWIKQQLKIRLDSGELRSLEVSDRSGIDFYSNDYLGLARCSDREQYLITEIKEHSLPCGSTGSRLISGNYPYIQEVESEFSEWFEFESGLIFNSGYSANLALMSAVAGRRDLILYDELCHASIRDGIRLAQARSDFFQHNSIPDLIKRADRDLQGNVFIVVESIYSMDGDLAPLQELVKLCSERNYRLIVDEAHSTGLYAEGRGLLQSLGLHKEVFAAVTTFGKAWGAHGAYVGFNSHEVKQYLINFSRPLIYTTAPTPHQVALLRVTKKMFEKKYFFNNRHQLVKNIEYFTEKSKLANHQTPIFVWPGGEGIEIEQLRSFAWQLQKSNFLVKPIYHPTVARGTERIRICMHSFNTEEQIDELVRKILF